MAKKGEPTPGFPPICIYCNTIGPKKLTDHKPSCKLVRRDKQPFGKRTSERLQRLRKANNDQKLGQVNKPGRCRHCGERANNLLSHLPKCKGLPKPKPEPTMDAIHNKPPKPSAAADDTLIENITRWIEAREVSESVALDAIDLAERFPLLSPDWIRRIVERAAERGVAAGKSDYQQIIELFPKLRAKVLGALRGGLTRRKWLEVEQKRRYAPVLNPRQQIEVTEIRERHHIDEDMAELVVRGTIDLQEAVEAHRLSASRSDYDYQCPDCGSAQPYHSCDRLDSE